MSLMWRMMKPLWVTEKIVIIDRGLCVLRELIGVFERGVYISTLVKKFRYWPTVNDGDGINSNFEPQKR